METEDLMSLTEVANLFRLHRRTVLHLPIKQVRLGARSIRFKREDVEAYIESRREDTNGN